MGAGGRARGLVKRGPGPLLGGVMEGQPNGEQQLVGAAASDMSGASVGLDELDMDMTSALLSLEGGPEPAGDNLGMAAGDGGLTTPPPLPTVDYHHRLAEKFMEWPELEAGLEPEANGELSFVWPIRHWSRLAAEERAHGPGVALGGFRWTPMLQPRGDRELRNRGIGLFLQAAPEDERPGWSVCARVILGLRNPADPTLVLAKPAQHRFDANEPDWGYAAFTTPGVLAQGDAGTRHQALLADDGLEVVVRVQIIRDPTGVLWHNFVNYDSKKATGHVGLLNQGATCYMNSLLQSLFHTHALRRATFQIPTEGDRPTESIALALQRTFFRLQTSEAPVGTQELTRSFGWDSVESFMQHDVHEFSRVLLDELEKRMKGTAVGGTVERLLTGRVQSVKKCTQVAFESVREEAFYDVQLTVRGMRSLTAAFEAYIRPEALTGDNKYHTDAYGYQEAEMFSVFGSFPPVLHLHLERYTFDPVTGNTIKINDRFEFPTHINLEAYLAAGAERPVPLDYTLHSVLCHGGDSQGGHYFVYICLGGRWFKFDDTRVTQVSEAEAVQDNYGLDAEGELLGLEGDAPYMRLPSYTRAQRLKKVTNAYMLVYLRDADAAQIMEAVQGADIPAYIGAGVRAEEEAEQRRRAEKHDTLMVLHAAVFTDEALRGYGGPDMVNVSNGAYPLTAYEPVKTRKDNTCEELRALVAITLGVEEARLRLWSFATRRNHTNRVDSPMERGVLAGFLGGNRYLASIHVYAEVAAPGEALPELAPGAVLLHAKWFDRAAGRLVPLGGVVVDREAAVEDVYAAVRGRIEGAPAAAAVEAFEEIKASRVDPIAMSSVLASNRMGTGDIVVFQQAEPEGSGLPAVLQHYADLAQRIVIAFRPHDGAGSRKRSSEDLPMGGFAESQGVFRMDQPFGLVAAEAAAKAGASPAYVRLHIMDPRSERFWPFKSLDRPDLTLQQALITSSPIQLPSRDALQELTFAVEVLAVPLLELELMKPVNLHLVGFPGVDPAASIEHYVAFDGTLQSLLDRLPAPYCGLLDHEACYRLLEVVGHRVTQYYAQDELLAAVGDYADVYLEAVDAAEAAADAKLVTVFQYQGDALHAHSVPFVFALLPGEPFEQTRARLLERAGLADAAVALFAYNIRHPVAADDVLYDRVKTTSGTNRAHGSDSLGLEVADGARAPSPAGARAAERSIKIRSSAPATGS